MASSGPSRRRIAGLRNDLASAYRDVEIYWKTKSRNNWLELGDHNTKFFHACTKTRFSKNRIHSIKDTSRKVYRGDKDIGLHAESFFQNIYQSTNNPVVESIFDDFIPPVTSEINNTLTKDFTNSEIYEALCQIGADKAPGPMD